MVKHIVRLWKEEDGTTAVEYGLMIALISAALLAAAALLGANITTNITNIAGIVAS